MGVVVVKVVRLGVGGDVKREEICGNYPGGWSGDYVVGKKTRKIRQGESEREVRVSDMVWWSIGEYVRC